MIVWKWCNFDHLTTLWYTLSSPEKAEINETSLKNWITLAAIVILICDRIWLHDILTSDLKLDYLNKTVFANKSKNTINHLYIDTLKFCLYELFLCFEYCVQTPASQWQILHTLLTLLVCYKYNKHGSVIGSIYVTSRWVLFLTVCVANCLYITPIPGDSHTFPRLT